MARVYKRGAVWWAQWRGERFSLGCTDRKAAELEFAKRQRRAADPTLAHEGATDLSTATSKAVAVMRSHTAAVLFALAIAVVAAVALAPTAEAHGRRCVHIAPHCHVQQHAVCVCNDPNELRCEWVCSY